MLKKSLKSAKRQLTRTWRTLLVGNIKQLMNFYAPFVGAGIRIEEASPDYRRMVVAMDLTIYNQNFVGTHFGGSLYAMTDPFYMLMIMQNLGPDYIVWDKAATVHFRKPGRGKVRAVFTLTQERIDEIRAQAAEQYKVEPVFMVEVIDEAGDVVAEVEKVLYVRKKKDA
ncbi:DUF4442 domain-containing protein [Bradymonas sediminis]|uniref:Tetrameric acyl-CoA thioesterase n=1 Tax=Bradymonas sediminis TaxID=1548548 RepID=A0A2Z4FNR0_9DELT|nr:DUF4442 domain-containing protein [Bradymonas sediminis]AWV90637.1 tetrameric acyl-CoA thioesterase [Bradymonas sediminis]TDP62360.1 uncharacterized protein DUF4442 [Bradymonas sediminis]